MRFDLDKFDIRLLNLMQSNNLATAEELSRQVPLSPSAITRRIRRLRKGGVIAQDVSVLDQSLLQGWVRGLVLIRLATHGDTAELAALRRALNSAAHIQSCFEMSGAFDIGAIVVARGMDEFNQTVDRVIGNHPAVQRFETNFFKREIKKSFLVPLDEEAGVAR